MAISLTSTGLSIDSYEDIVLEIETKEKELIDPNIITDDDLLLGQLNKIVAERFRLLEEGLRAVYAARSLNESEGVALDGLVSILDITRIEALEAIGIQEFTVANGSTIPANTEIRNPNTLQRFTTDETVVASLTSCRGVSFSIPSPVANTTYQISINGVVASVIYGSSPGTDELRDIIYEAFLSAIDAGNISGLTGVNDSENQILTFYLDPSEADNLVVSANLNVAIDSLVVRSNITATNTGAIVVEARSVTQLLTGVTGFKSTLNPFSIISGSDRESDEDLRARAKLSIRTSGKAVPEAILRAVLAVDGVSSASLIQNNVGLLPDVEGRPAKSFEVIVQGGSDNAVGLAIWDSGAAGIETYGNTSVIITDSFSEQQVINFSRPSLISIQFQVEYEINSEGTFPSDGEEQIRQAVQDYVASLSVGNNIIPKKSYPYIYGALGYGLGQITVKTRLADIGTFSEEEIILDSTELATIVAPESTGITIIDITA